MVKVRYYDSRFMGHTTHKDLVENFNIALKDLDMTEVLQLSMGGPKVNLKFLEEIQKGRRLEQMQEVIDIGTCNLHTVHGALETGVEKSGWDLKKLLKGAFLIFHLTAARRDDYYKLTGSTMYPLQFIATRWKEDKRVGGRHDCGPI